jgi:hypothetical protein
LQDKPLKLLNSLFKRQQWHATHGWKARGLLQSIEGNIITCPPCSAVAWVT